MGPEAGMKAAVYYGKGDIRIEDVPKPRIGPGEMLLRVRGCGLCGSDIAKIVQGTVEPPAVLGHEVVGVVAEVGDGVEGFEMGDRVVAAHHVPCGQCHYCRHGNPSMCRTFKATKLDPGGFAEYVRLSPLHVAHTTLHIPAGLSDEEASFAEPLACCLRGIKRSPPQEGDTVLVVGAGTIGLLMLQLARIQGAKVMVTDLIEGRLDLARSLGADLALKAKGDVAITVNQFTAGRGADVAILTAGAVEPVAQALECVRDGGMINVFAGIPPGSSIPLDVNQIYHREITILGSYSSSPLELREALGLLAEGAVRVEGLVTYRLPLTALPHAIELARRHEALKVFITMEGLWRR